MSRGGFRVRAVGPELGEDPGVVAARYPLRFVRSAGDRVEGIAPAEVSAVERVEKVRIVLERRGVGGQGNVAYAGRRDIDQLRPFALARIELG